eukprot:GEMP01049072.1.p1 GENE.GEMP01049072.1~~GEMP01049072.1.p1  ORF type:complete len:120 (+),score=30.16 GEMP01049072.1:90-449(+)
MANAIKINYDTCEEKKPHESASVRVAEIDESRKSMRIALKKGFHWTKCMKEKMGTDLCQADHFGFLEKGKLKVIMKGGQVLEIGAGDCYHIPPGHDAEALEDVVMFEFSAMSVDMYKDK